MAKHSPPLPDFETSLGELERIASTMESGQMPLGEALSAYQRGISLLKHCQGTLAAAEQQIEVLDQGLMASLPANTSATDTDLE
jgi:exodeoxyribonuclease VII small subunit